MTVSLHYIIVNRALKQGWESIMGTFNKCSGVFISNIFQNWPRVFQKGSAAAQKFKITQQWLGNLVPEFIGIKNWTSDSPVLNPVDYKFWSVLDVTIIWSHWSRRCWKLWTILLRMSCIHPSMNDLTYFGALLRQWKLFE